VNDQFHPGQRWISESEPELGLGSVLRVSDRTVTVVFGASAAQREYSRRNAPLRRVRFRAGDTLTSHRNTTLVVQSVEERDGLLYYCAGKQKLPETELSDTISFNKPEERFFAGQLDPKEAFDLRVAALNHQHRRRKSSVRGFTGGRIALIPHQLYIASEVTGRLAPRVLLADEVGLGKTIEACLILHRLILTGRAQRALILVPESLIHQWFVELLRRFNLWFHIFDEERCQSIEAMNPENNPFLDDQFMLCSITLFTASERRTEQALAAGWDILVVDEAHHLGWAPDAVSPEYKLVETLSRKTPGLLLLTATPEQLGVASHFARLRLLDPDRFYNLDEFVHEAAHYKEVAREADKLAAKPERTVNEAKRLASLLDQHGTGRVSFRNTRATISGFPKRLVRLAPLKAESSRHERMDWLVALYRSVDPDKILLICRTPEKVRAIETGLRRRIRNVELAVFHEGLTLVQRDRNAAWFSEEDGARILLCSEIGSEGRNFQFAHHLVLFDLPLDPELLEQRIGRLDRIGQTSEIEVHVPFVVGSELEVLTRWYHEGLNAFEENLHGGLELLERFGARVHDLAQNFRAPMLARLIEETREAHGEIKVRLRDGRDRLLELNSFRPDVAAALVDDIQQLDDDRALDDFMISVFERYAIQVEEIASRTYRLGSAGAFADAFPGLPSRGFTVTGDRERALAREDIQFLTWDHPIVSGALDLLLGSEKGNASFAHWADAESSGLYLEAIFVLECIAPPHLHVDRFLPPTPVRVVVDHAGKAFPDIFSRYLQNGNATALLENPALREETIPRLLESAQTIAADEAPRIIERARKEMAAQLDREVARLKELRKVNPSVRADEIDLLVKQRRSLDEHLRSSRLRLDAIRLVQREKLQ
jgi:ATP-dependent helicase HepA